MEAVKRPYTIQEEIWSSLIHGIGIALSIAGLIVLVTLAAQDDQFVNALEKGKQHLSPRQRIIFEMNKEYGMSISEISEKLSITNQVVRNQLCMALKILRVELRQYYPLLLLFLKDI